MNMEPDGISECPYCGRFCEVPEAAEVVRIRARLGRVEALEAEIAALRARAEAAEQERSGLRHHLGILVAHLLTMDSLPTTLRQRAEDAAAFLKRTAGEGSSRG